MTLKSCPLLIALVFGVPVALSSLFLDGYAVVDIGGKLAEITFFYHIRLQFLCFVLAQLQC